MIRKTVVLALCFAFFGCEADQNNLEEENFEFLNLNLPINAQDNTYFKTIFELNDTLVSVFLNKDAGQIQRAYYLDSTCVKRDTIVYGYSIQNLSYIQKIEGGILVFTPLDSVKLSTFFLDSNKFYGADDFILQNGNTVSFGLETKLITDYKSTATSFEFRLGAMSNQSESPMTGNFDFKTEVIKPLGINYPERYRTNYYGFLHDIQEIYTDSFIVYNPIALSEVWVYNRVTKSVDVKTVKSRYHSKEVESISVADKAKSEVKTILEKHQAANGNYSRLIYNKHRKCYYRFYQQPQALKTSDGYFTTYQNRRVSCIKLNLDFEPVSEIMLPESCFFIYVAIPTSKGFIINRGSLMEDKHLQLLSVEF